MPSPVLADGDIAAVYFDEAATRSSHETTGPMERVEAFLYIVSPGASIAAFAADARIEGQTGGFCAAYLLGPWNGFCEFAWAFGGGTPVDPAPRVQVVSLSFLVESPAHRVEFHLDPPSLLPEYGYPFYADANNDVHPLQHPSGDWSQPLAVINPLGVVPVEAQSWSRLKALF